MTQGEAFGREPAVRADGRLRTNRSRMAQRLLVYNPLRASLQRRTEAPWVLSGFSLPPGAECNAARGEAGA
jgi:hypothetical protein